MPSILTARLQVLLAVGLMSLGGVGIKACSFPAWKLAGMRGGVAALTVFLLLKEARRNWSLRVILVGAALAATFILYVWGNKTTTAANTIFIQSSAPLWVLLFSPLVLKEGIHLRDALSMLIMTGGLMLFFIAPEKPTILSPDIARGNWFALGSGVAYAFAIMGLRALRGRGAETAVVCGNCFTFVFCVILLIWPGGNGIHTCVSGRIEDWLIVAGLGSVQIGVAYILFVRGLRLLRATQTALIGLIEPALNPLWVFIVFREERPGPYALLGGAIIIGAACYQIISHRSEGDGAAA